MAVCEIEKITGIKKNIKIDLDFVLSMLTDVTVAVVAITQKYFYFIYNVVPFVTEF